MENSHILSLRGEEKNFAKILVKLKNINIPVKTEYKDGHIHFYYEGWETDAVKGWSRVAWKCDGNTAEYIRQVITGLVGLNITHS